MNYVSTVNQINYRPSELKLVVALLGHVVAGAGGGAGGAGQVGRARPGVMAGGGGGWRRGGEVDRARVQLSVHTHNQGCL